MILTSYKEVYSFMTAHLRLFCSYFFFLNLEICVLNPPPSYNHTESHNPHTEKQSWYVLKIYFFFAANPGFHQAEEPHAHSLIIQHNSTLAKCFTDADYLLKSDLSEFAPKQRLHSRPNTGLIDPTNKKKKILPSTTLKKPPLTIFFTLLEKLDLVEERTVHWQQRRWL